MGVEPGQLGMKIYLKSSCLEANTVKPHMVKKSGIPYDSKVS